jgi:deoxyribodipyrimidine photolyase-related protein
LDDYGAFEDPISATQTTLFHSVLIPMLNIGLLTPAEVINRTLEWHRQRPVPLNSLEGFVRQIIGWREFIRGIDRDYETMNLPAGPFRHTRQLNSCWYDGSTGLPPLDTAIQRARDHAFCHHIERLMVIGSAMLMCEVEPLEANRWFMEMFIDAAEWVMRPNVLGMSQFADGGYFATKPYLSGSNYLLKMSDFPKGPWCDVWDGLYWRFIDRNRAFFAGNHRLSVMVKGVDRLDPLRRDRIFAAAESFIDLTTSQLV